METGAVGFYPCRAAPTNKEEQMMRTEVVSVTPALASQWLTLNANPRNLNAVTVARYALDMINGSWELTHQGIAFNSSGQLVDGQHRLSAIVESGVTVEMTVAHGMDAITRVDLGDKRSPAVILRLAGLSHQNSTIAAIKGATAYPSGYNATTAMSTATAVELMVHHEAVARFLDRHVTKHTRAIAIAPVLSAIARAYYHVDKDRLAEFVHVLFTGRCKDAFADVGALLLRSYLLTTVSRFGAAAIRAEVYLKTERAIQAFVAREDLGVLKAGNKSLWPYFTTTGLSDEPFTLAGSLRAAKSTQEVVRDVA
jgi:hypothetical protein